MDEQIIEAVLSESRSPSLIFGNVELWTVEKGIEKTTSMNIIYKLK